MSVCHSYALSHCPWWEVLLLVLVMMMVMMMVLDVIIMVRSCMWLELSRNNNKEDLKSICVGGCIEEGTFWKTCWSRASYYESLTQRMEIAVRCFDDVLSWIMNGICIQMQIPSKWCRNFVRYHLNRLYLQTPGETESRLIKKAEKNFVKLYMMREGGTGKEIKFKLGTRNLDSKDGLNFE